MGYKLIMLSIIKYIVTILIVITLLVTIVIHDRNRNKTIATNENNAINEINNARKLMEILSSENDPLTIKKEAFEILIQENINLNSKDAEGKTPLMYAAFNNDTEIINAIIKRDVDVNNVDSIGRTALHWASYYGNEDALIILLQNKVDLSIKDINESTALDLARFEGHENIITILESLENN